jgi:hypothetical protein
LVIASWQRGVAGDPERFLVSVSSLSCVQNYGDKPFNFLTAGLIGALSLMKTAKP